MELISSSYDILSASTVGFPDFFFWVHFAEPTTKKITNEKIKIPKKKKKKRKKKSRPFKFSCLKKKKKKPRIYLVVRRVEEEAFYQLGEVDITVCWSGLQPE